MLNARSKIGLEQELGEQKVKAIFFIGIRRRMGHSPFSRPAPWGATKPNKVKKK